MPRIIPSLDIQTKLDKQLVSGHLKILYFQQMRVYRTMFQPTENNMTWRITTLSGSELPRHVLIAFQSSKREVNQEFNSMIFDNANLRRIGCRINPFSPACATFLAELCNPITHQAIELESCSNPLRIQQVV